MLRQPVEAVISLYRAEKISLYDALNLWIGSVLRSEVISRYYPRKIALSPTYHSPQSVVDNSIDLWAGSFKQAKIFDAESFVQPTLYRTKSDSVRDSFIESNPELKDFYF